ncbi:hypothetical protein GP486_004447 [Trichoglossum hirsutum]|uniref:Uncharacterized protein n=1 Tax=Trichoglossum hirsutum TaxID=265104 RepID=A0A9P8LB56_9PEZI|nr:hypothetical protein GP486_004447 [Trichoglossum hirsutum]
MPMNIESHISITADGKTPLHIAAQIRSAATVNRLLNTSAHADQKCGQGETTTPATIKDKNLETPGAVDRRLDTQDNSGQTALHKAVRWPQGVQHLLELGATPDIPDHDGNTPLHVAVAANSMECFSLLVAKSQVQVRNRDDLTAADLAFHLKRKEMLNAFIDMAVLPTKPNEKGQSLLHQACEEGDDALAILLLNKGAGMNETDNMGRMPLELLAWKPNKPLAEELIRRGCNWESVLLRAASGGQHNVISVLLTYARGDLQGILHEAWSCSVRDDHFRVGTVLLAAGLGIEHKDGQGATPLWKAVESGAKKSIEILLARHPSLDTYCAGMTPLHKAVTNDSLAIIECLLEAGASPNLREGKWLATPLLIAIQVGSTRAARLLLRYGADKELRTNNKTPLESAIDRKSASIAQLLLEKGASTDKCREWLNDAIDNNDSSITHVLLPYTTLSGVEINEFIRAAAMKQYVAVIRALLKRVHVEARNPQYGYAALVWAAKNGHLAVVEVLLENGADVNASNTDALTALQLAAESGHETVVQLLIRKGASIEAHPRTTRDNSSDIFVLSSSTTDRNGKRALHLAAENGHEAIALLLIEGGADLNSGDYGGRTAVHLAAENGHGRVALLLTQKGADPKAGDSSGKTALHLASENGHASLIQLLLQTGVNIDAEDLEGDTALHLAASNDREAVTRVLIAEGARIKVQNNAGMTALHRAVNTSSIRTVQILLKANANPDDGSNRNESLLHTAIQNNALEIVRLLLQHGANAEVLVKDKTPLEAAVGCRSSSIAQFLLENGVSTSKCKALLSDSIRSNDLPSSHVLLRSLNLSDAEVQELYWKTNPHGREEIFQLLLQKGIDLTTMDDRGLTTLHWAVHRGYQSVARMLLEKGVYINGTGGDGWTPLYRAVQRGHEKLALMLLEMEADIASRADQGHTALHVAAEKGSEAVVDTLLKMGANIMSTTDDRRTALHCAAQEGHEPIIRLLLGKGADVAARSNGGRTALHCASRTGHESVVRLLLENGAATTATTKYENDTALHWAAGNGHEAVVRLLLEKGAPIDAVNVHAYTPLCHAAKAGHDAIVRLLLEMGSEINKQIHNGYMFTTRARIALIAADSGGHAAVMRLLVERGLDVSTMDDGYTALHRAARQGFNTVVRLLLDNGAEIDKKSRYGMTALMLAAWEGHHSLTRILLDEGAKINTEEDVDGETALHGAARNGHGAVVQLLLEKGADVEARDRLGRTAFTLATQRGFSTATLALQAWYSFPDEMRRSHGGWNKK